VRGQLDRCASGTFRLIYEEDGPEDYRLTSEAWLTGIRRALASWRMPRVGCAALPGIVRRPIHTARMLRCMLGSESRNWQFRGDPAPTVLLRQMWERIG
jgi:hypothetical protein